jgi:hypothetical protein
MAGGKRRRWRKTGARGLNGERAKWKEVVDDGRLGGKRFFGGPQPGQYAPAVSLSTCRHRLRPIPLHVFSTIAAAAAGLLLLLLLPQWERNALDCLSLFPAHQSLSLSLSLAILWSELLNYMRCHERTEGRERERDRRVVRTKKTEGKRKNRR